ncbi:MAG: MarR family transcriptional regulator [Oscillospiraceae bacterium]|nr:MarR family transcriptional regulator [Oscillospiraceae bacterium]
MTSKYESLYLENQLCFPLYACAKEIVRQYRKPLSGLDLTYTQYIAMMVLWEFGDMTEGELGKKLHLDSGTLAPLLKRLEKQGLLERNRLAGNERKLFLSLTPQGRAMREQALEVPRAMQGCLDLPEEELMELKRLLEKALASMEGRSN